MSAPPPSAQVGRAAVEQAQASGQMAKATNLAEADALAERRLAGGSAEVRRAGGRLFRRQGDVWTDVAHADSLRVVTVAPFSAAYFAVTRALPELREALAVADQALVAGRRASLAVGPTGRTTLAEAELRAFVRDFRGGT